ncbi:MAG: hypothetical protein QW369_00860 [Desulfurococcaceae archaeon]
MSNEISRPLPLAVEAQQNTFEIIELLELYDGLCKDFRHFIDATRSLEVMPKPVTGDNIHVAKAIASRVNIGEKAIAPRQIPRDWRISWTL